MAPIGDTVEPVSHKCRRAQGAGFKCSLLGTNVLDLLSFRISGKRVISFNNCEGQMTRIVLEVAFSLFAWEVMTKRFLIFRFPVR